MGKHEFLDKITAGLGGLYGEKVKFFNRSIESESIRETLEGIQIPELADFSKEGETRVTARWKGREIETRFKVVTWLGVTHPTLIFHHGSGDNPYYGRIEKILKQGGGLRGVNIIATDSPFNSSIKDYLGAIGGLQDFVLILTVSAQLMESITQRLKLNGAPKIVLSGISLGGWIMNIHHAYFNTGDEYRPIFAGAALEDLFFNSAYSKLASKRLDGNETLIRRVLNFEDDFRKIPPVNVWPLLGRYDQYIVYDRQKGIYPPENISVLEKGHITGSLDNKALQEHLHVGFRDFNAPAPEEAPSCYTEARP